MKRRVVVIATVLSIMALILVGCPANKPSDDTAANTPQTETDKTTEMPPALTYDEWVAGYPAQYNSYAVEKWEEDDKNHSHYYLRTLVEEYTGKLPLNGSCISCKTSSFNALYEKHGEEVLTLPWDEVKGQVEAYWDCGMCHTDSQTLALDPSLIYFEKLGADTFATTDVKTRICGQCHNGLAIYRTLVGSPDATFDDFKPYRYGTDGAGVYKAALEDNCGTAYEEATGATIVRGTGENDLEVFTNSIHENLGLTCVDCHMTSSVAEDGEPYTNHNASGSPLDNPEALEYCLSCHTAQGIDSTSEMITFVRDTQEAMVELQTVANDKLASVKQRLTDATAAKSIDEASLNLARSNYAEANFYIQYYTCMLPDGAKVAHNPIAILDYLNRSYRLLDEAESLLGA